MKVQNSILWLRDFQVLEIKLEEKKSAKRNLFNLNMDFDLVKVTSPHERKN